MHFQVREAKPKSFKNVYARDPDAGLQRERTYHLNDDGETEIEQGDVVAGERHERGCGARDIRVWWVRERG